MNTIFELGTLDSLINFIFDIIEIESDPYGYVTETIEESYCHFYTIDETICSLTIGAHADVIVTVLFDGNILQLIFDDIV